MQRIFDIFGAAGHQIFLVGGFVRDRLLGVDSDDIDFATSAKPDETIAVLEAAELPVIPTGIEFGTIQTILDGEKVEITTFRCKESYTKGSRNPSVQFGTIIEEDLVRRDFTFNAMAERADGSLIDPFDGQSDLRAGCIRVPGNPIETFTDDPLRILRAARFLSRGWTRHIGLETSAAMRECASLTLELSIERVFEEMTKLLVSSNPGHGLQILADTGVLKVLFPELQVLVDDRRSQGKWHNLPVWFHTVKVVEKSEPIAEVRWAALFHDVAKPLCRSVDSKGDVHFFKHDIRGAEIWELVARRLKTSNDFREHVSQLIFEHQNGRRQPMGTKAVRRLVHRLGDRLENLFHLSRADILAHHPKFEESSLADLQWVIDRTREIGSVSNRLPTGTGDVVAKALGIKPGPELGAVIKGLQKQLVDGIITLESDLVHTARHIYHNIRRNK